MSASEKVRTSAEALAVAGDVGHAALVQLPRGPMPVTSRRRARDRPAGRLAQAGERLDELVLAVAGDAGDAEDLAGTDLEADAADDLLAAVVRRP